jgi:plasmid stability protein
MISPYDITMADLLLRNVPPKTLDALRARARARNRSVAAEALEVLETGVEMTLGESLLAWVKTVRRSDVDFNQAVRFVREMRDER